MRCVYIPYESKPSANRQNPRNSKPTEHSDMHRKTHDVQLHNSGSQGCNWCALLGLGHCSIIKSCQSEISCAPVLASTHALVDIYTYQEPCTCSTTGRLEVSLSSLRDHTCRNCTWTGVAVDTALHSILFQISSVAFWTYQLSV